MPIDYYLSIIQDKERSDRLLSDRYLSKPINTELLLSDIKMLLTQEVSHKKVLVVDADLSTTKFLTDVLISKGYAVTEALEIIQTQKPNLVFLDVMMPKMNGFEVCQIVKQNADTQNIHIIMLTAKGQEFDQQKGKEVGADLYMTKLFDPDEIVKKALEILGLVE